MTHSFDLGIHDQALYTLLRLGYMRSTQYGVEAINYIGDHFSPIFYLVVPFYALYPDAKTLLVLQSLALGIGAIPVYLLARSKTGSAPLAVVLSIVYLLYPALHGVNTFDFHQIDARTPVIADEVIAQGRSCDLVVVSATNPDEITGVERDFVEQVVMAVGRPVIVLPAKGDARISLAEIVVGWDGGREAARAAFDALPLLKQAQKVRVVRIDPQKDPTLRGSVAGADLAETLARHGIKAEAQGYPTDGLDEGQALMRCAEDTGAGLIVMGAYGHSRLAEFIFGGATRFVLTRMTRPVLMSH